MNRRSDILAVTVFSVSLAGYLALHISLGRFSHADETSYKAAGRQWAATGAFAVPEFTGWLDVDPPLEEIYFVHSPLYPFLFGLFVKVAGFGWRPCVVFDAILHGFLAVLTVATVRRVAPGSPRWVAFAAGLAVLPLGTSSKPDELAICFAMAGLLPLLGSTIHGRQAVVSGILFGFSAATHPIAAVVLGLVAIGLLFTDEARGTRRGMLALVWAVAAAAVLVTCLLPILLTHPGAYRQYQAHAAVIAQQAGGLPAFLLAWAYGKWTILSTLAWLLLGISAAWPARSESLGMPWVRMWLTPLCGAVILATFFPLKHLYYWFLGPWLLVASAVTICAVVSRRRQGLAGVLLTLAGLGVVAGSVPWVKQTLVLLNLPESQGLAFNTRQVQDLIPAGSTVVTDEYWWVLAGNCRVYDPWYARLQRLDEIDYFVLVGNGSGTPGSPRSVPERWQAYVEENFRPIHDNLNRTPLTLCGLRLTNSAYGFGTVVLARNGGRGKLEDESDRR